MQKLISQLHNKQFKMEIESKTVSAIENHSHGATFFINTEAYIIHLCKLQTCTLVYVLFACVTLSLQLRLIFKSLISSILLRKLKNIYV